MEGEKREVVVNPKRNMCASKLVSYSHLHSKVMKQILVILFAPHGSLGRLSAIAPQELPKDFFSKNVLSEKTIV